MNTTRKTNVPTKSETIAAKMLLMEASYLRHPCQELNRHSGLLQEMNHRVSPRSAVSALYLEIRGKRHPQVVCRLLQGEASIPSPCHQRGETLLFPVCRTHGRHCIPYCGNLSIGKMKTYRCHVCQNEWAEIRITLARCPYCGSKDFTLVKVVTDQGRTDRTTPRRIGCGVPPARPTSLQFRDARRTLLASCSS